MITVSPQAKAWQYLARQEGVFKPPGDGEGSRLDSSELEKLRKKIDSKEYRNEAIQRIALVLSNELLNIYQKGLYHERKRRK
jgi:hypothetical protein